MKRLTTVLAFGQIVGSALVQRPILTEKPFNPFGVGNGPKLREP
jgi:hypothetical protein